MKKHVKSETVSVKVSAPKERVMWTISPVTRKTPNPNAYNRNSAKRAVREELRKY